MGKVKAITLWQPWASLIAGKVKKVETRSWRTHYQGPILIHAAYSLPPLPVLNQFLNDEDARLALVIAAQNLGIPVDCRQLIDIIRDLPRGKFVARANLADVVPTIKLTPNRIEKACGGFDAGRFGWILEDVEELQDQPLVKGKQGLWDWAVPGAS